MRRKKEIKVSLYAIWLKDLYKTKYNIFKRNKLGKGKRNKKHIKAY